MEGGSTDRREAEHLYSTAERVAPAGARPSGRMRLLLAAGAALLLAACGRAPTEPFPPHAPPRPVTKANGLITAQLVLPARPVPPAPGPM